MRVVSPHKRYGATRGRMQDKRKVGHSSMAIASSAKERERGRKGQDVLWVGSDRWRRASLQSATAALGHGRWWWIARWSR